MKINALYLIFKGLITILISQIATADDCGWYNQKACHCTPEAYTCALIVCHDCSPHDSCAPGYQVVGASSYTWLFGWSNEATCDLNRTNWIETPISNDRNASGESCGDMNCWKYDDTVRDQLNMNTSDLNLVTNVKNGLPGDGRYIYVYRKSDNSILVRPYDRSETTFSLQYPGNCRALASGRIALVGCKLPNLQSGGYLHVRHSQLNSGWDPVWCAGEMVIKNGKICLANNVD